MRVSRNVTARKRTLWIVDEFSGRVRLRTARPGGSSVLNKWTEFSTVPSHTG